ncbi:MAG: acyl-CoA thioesterase [Acidimicrobiia bacterium]
MGMQLAESFVAEPVGENRYRFPNPIPEGRGVIFGGHLLGVLAMAAARTDEGKSVKSAQGVFAKPVSADDPFEVSVDILNKGRVLSTMTSSVWQNGRECARAIVMLTAAERDLLHHGDAMPDVPGPAESVAWPESLGREMRIVGGVDRHDPAVVGPPDLYVWLRHPDAGSDPLIAQAVVAHASAGFLMGTQMLPYDGIGERMAHDSISTGIVAHGVSFHEPADLSQWLLVTSHGTHAAAGRAAGRGLVFTEDGTLVASFNQEAIIRHFPEGHSASGRERTVL